MPEDRRTVYSTDGSFPLPEAPPKPKPKLAPKPRGPQLPDDGIVRVGHERRRGGSVTVIYGLAPAELDVTCTALRRSCGTGGTAKAGIVELQGEHREAALAFFAKRGRRTKRMGGELASSGPFLKLR